MEPYGDALVLFWGTDMPILEMLGGDMGPYNGEKELFLR